MNAKKGLLFCLFKFFLLSFGFTQPTFKITILKIPKLNPNSLPTFQLERYEKDSFVKIGAFTLKGDSIETIIIPMPKNVTTGLFCIYLSEKTDKAINKAEFIWNPKEDAIYETYFYALKNGEVSIQNSTENEAYSQLLKIKKEFEPMLETAYKARMAANVFQPDFKRKITAMELETEKIQLLFNNNLAKLAESFPNTYTGKVLVPLNLIPLRSAKEEWANQYDSYLSFLHKNYFLHIDFNNEAMLNHYALSDKLFSYLNRYIATHTDGIKAGLDVIFSQLKENETVNSFVFNTLLKSFIQTNKESIIKYLMDNHKAGCALNLPIEELKKLETIQALSIGGLIPEISLPDSAGKYQSLRTITQKNKYTILYIWISWCNRCQKETPKLVELYKKYKSKGLGIFAVSLDEKKDDWISAVQKYNTTWINVAELVPIKQSQIIKNYQLATTPALFILNSKGEIVAKNIFGERLDSELSIYLK
ncbi:MAG: TlpA family protein disulfide reductase [Bacteroidia bacterium]|nr:TlpA family protein disulfide reductase [Bacteroidia bacterium]